MYLNIKELIEQSVCLSKNVVILSNGLLLSSYGTLLDYHNLYFNISLDSILSDYHNQLRGFQSDIIQNLTDMSKHGTKITIETTISPVNLLEIPYILDFAKKHQFNVDFHLIDSPMDQFNWANSDKKTKTMLFILLESWSRECRYNSIKFKLMQYALLDFKNPLSRCLYEKGLFINVYGNAYPCFNNKDICFGNLHANTDIISNWEYYWKNKKRPIDCFKNICSS